MRRSSVEISVGIFVLIGFLCVGYLTIRLGQMAWFGDDHYRLYANFESATGLKAGNRVEMAGVPIGRVANINLDKEEHMARVELTIRRDIKLTDDVIASVKTAGLIGEKYIKLSPGGSDIILEPEDIIIETISTVDIEELISKYVFGGVK
jgi:phospholipid/cholesterol/gamma-HCH transport system substrate-binding protein